MIRITIDGQEIHTKPDRTVLEVAREKGIRIPTLCHHEALEAYAACRLCVVEVDTGGGWKLVASCAYPCTNGLVIRTHSEAIVQSRRLTVELLMASAAHVPLIQQLADEFGVGEPRFSMARDDCILCGLCVRVCTEIVGIAAISLINRGIEKKVSPPFQIASNSCIGCGTCVLLCPTGALTLADITGGKPTVHAWGSAFESTDCHICGYHDLAPKTTDISDFMSKEEISPAAIEKEAPT